MVNKFIKTEATIAKLIKEKSAGSRLFLKTIRLIKKLNKAISREQITVQIKRVEKNIFSFF